MIALKLKAGLGNQMFQYAFARALQLRSMRTFGIDIPLKLDLSWYDSQNASRDTVRSYGLNHFSIKAGILTDAERASEFGYVRTAPYRLALKIYRKAQRALFGFSDYVFYPSLAKPVRKAYIDSYFWNSEAYFSDFKEEIRADLSLKEPFGEAAQSAIRDIGAARQSGKIPVLLTVRRSDYVANKHANEHHGAKDESYYLQAIKELSSKMGAVSNKIHFFISSDDLAWVEKNIHPADEAGLPYPVTFLTRPGMEDYEEMHVMAQCRHFIIGNSTFHWWGAWLSEEAVHAGMEKIVIGPKRWLNDTKIDTRDVMPESWIRI